MKDYFCKMKLSLSYFELNYMPGFLNYILSYESLFTKVPLPITQKTI